MQNKAEPEQRNQPEEGQRVRFEESGNKNEAAGSRNSPKNNFQKLVYAHRQNQPEFQETEQRSKLIQKSRPDPVTGYSQIKNFFSQLKTRVVDHGPRVVESSLNSTTTLQEKDWRTIIKKESREDISHSILYNSLRRGVPQELRPQIWAFLINIEKMQAQYVDLV